MIKSIKEYMDKILKSSGEEENKNPNPNKMRKVNIFDKLKFKKINSKLKPRVSSNNSRVNKADDEGPKLNVEKVKEAVLIISAVVLIGVRICEFFRK